MIYRIKISDGIEEKTFCTNCDDVQGDGSSFTGAANAAVREVYRLNIIRAREKGGEKNSQIFWYVDSVFVYSEHSKST